MEIIAGILIILALVVMPIVIIIAMIKPQLFDINGSHERKELLAGGAVLIAIFLGLGLFLLPKGEEENKPTVKQAISTSNSAEIAKNASQPLVSTAPPNSTPASQPVQQKPKPLDVTPTQAKLLEMSKKTGVDDKTLQELINRAKEILVEDKKPEPTDDQMLEVIEFGNDFDKDCPTRTGDAKKCVSSSFAFYLTARGDETHENTMKGLKALRQGIEKQKPHQ